MATCLFCDPSFDPSANLILETPFWSVLLNHDQRYLGRCSIVLKRHCESLSDLDEREWLELKGIVGRLEAVFRECFNATLFNWTCLMNFAYRAEPAAPHVHFHFRPRYRTPVEFGGEVFSDTEFADHYEYVERRPLADELRASLVSVLRKRLK